MVQAVTAAPELKKLSLKDRDRRNQNNYKAASKKSFKKALDEAYTQSTPENAPVYICGYTKDALPVYSPINMKEYA